MSVRYCTGCTNHKPHNRLWLGTYCVRCRLTSIPRRWHFCVTAWLYDIGLLR